MNMIPAYPEMIYSFGLCDENEKAKNAVSGALPPRSMPRNWMDPRKTKTEVQWIKHQFDHPPCVL